MNITIIENGRQETAEFTEGETILDALHRSKAESYHAPCGGKGACKKCNVYVKSEDYCGTLLSCITPAKDGMIAELTPEIRSSFADSSNAPIYAPDEGLTGYAAAVDIGTTTVICCLTDLADGRQIATASCSNAQSIFGANVLSRLQAAGDGNSAAMTDLIVSQVNDCLVSLCRQVGIETDAIRYIAVSGNTIMLHFFAGLDPAANGINPFVPQTLFGTETDSASLKLCTGCPVYLLPAVSGLLGGDITAGMLASGMLDAEKCTFFADLGANAEIVLGSAGNFVACTTDSGAVLKASLLDRGMTACAGAVEAVDYADGEMKLKVIGDTEPLGLCGSGYIDALGVMVRLGAISETGRIEDPDDVDEDVARFIGQVNGEKVFFLTENHKVFLTQSDIARFQMAKGAVTAGITILAEECGISPEEIGTAYLAGGFGSFARPGNAGVIGLIPETLARCSVPLGNASLAGAISASVSSEARRKLSGIHDSVRLIDLPTHPHFNDAYTDGMLFENAE